MSIRLVVVDGHTLIQYAMRRLVEQQQDIEIVGECPTADGAAGLVAQLEPDVVTVDVALPDGNGLALARDLRSRFRSLGIVVLTSHGEDDVLFRALEIGVSAFVPKTAPVEEILGAIRHAAVAASSFTATGLADALARRRDVSERLALSPREREVLRLLQEGLSIPTIARTMYVSQSTAKTYVARLYDKLGASSRAQALMTALQLGLIQYQAAPEGRSAGLARAAARGAIGAVGAIGGDAAGSPAPAPAARPEARAHRPA
jgi:DNA-binding NarL/FixJ family response regulator